MHMMQTILNVNSISYQECFIHSLTINTITYKISLRESSLWRSLKHKKPLKCSDTTWLVFYWTVEGWAYKRETEVSLPHEVTHDVHGQWEDDGGVLLSCDGVESLQVAKLQGWRGLCDHEGRLLQRARGIHLTLCCDDLEPDWHVRITWKWH